MSPRGKYLLLAVIASMLAWVALLSAVATLFHFIH